MLAVGILAAPASALPLEPPPPGPVWVYHGAGSGDLAQVAVSPDGTAVFVTGTRIVDGLTKAYLAAHDAQTGALRWSFRSTRASLSRAVAVSPDGRTVVIGGHAFHRPLRELELTIWAFEAASGRALWSRTHLGDGEQPMDHHEPIEGEVRDITFSGDGAHVYAAGMIRHARSGRDLVVVAHRTRSGQPEWKHVHDSSTATLIRDDEAMAVTMSRDGSTVVAGGIGRKRDRTWGYASTVGVHSGTGARRWVRNDRPAGDEATLQVVTDLDAMGDSVYLATEARYGEGSTAGAARITAPDGRLGWQHRLESSVGQGCGTSGIDARAGLMHAVGTCHHSSAKWLVAWSRDGASGSLRWMREFELHGSFGFPTGPVALDEALLVGANDTPEGSSRQGIILVSFDLDDGAPTRVGAFLGAEHSTARDLAVAPGGIAFVSGRSGGRPVLLRFDLA